MFNISNFLDKFLNLEKDKNTKIFLIIESIKKETGIELAKENVEIKGDNLKLNCNSVFKNEIYMHKEGIESTLKSQKIFLKIL